MAINNSVKILYHGIVVFVLDKLFLLSKIRILFEFFAGIVNSVMVIIFYRSSLSTL